MDLEAVFPALSVADAAIALIPAFSATEQLNELPPAGAPLHVVVAIPERASIALPETEIVDLVEVKWSGGEAIVSTGGVLSMFSVMLALAMLPATSTAEPATV
jgi:hypothetical protein